MNIPRTRAAFDQLDFMSKQKVKKKLLQNNYNIMCQVVNPEDLPLFAPVLHTGDMETLKLSRNRDSTVMVNMKLLSDITRSLRRDPTWWQLLEQHVQAQGNNDLYYAMNPWDNRDVPDGGAAGGGGGGGGGGGRPPGPPPSNHPGPPPPSGPGPVTSPMPRPPYPKCTPLAETQGIAQLLRPLCDNSSDWRDLADNMGLVLRDQREILDGSRGNDIHRLLLDKLDQRLGEAANIQLLTSGLLELGDTGRDILDRMVDRGFIQPLEGEGSAAVGEVVCVPDDNVENGSTSTLALRAPTPRVPAGNVGLARNCSGVQLNPTPSPTGPTGPTSNQLNGPVESNRRRNVDGSPSNPSDFARSNSPEELNMSCAQPIKETPYPTLEGILPPPREDPVPSGLSRSRSERSRRPPTHSAVHRTTSVPASCSGLTVDTECDRRLSSDSLTDNASQMNVVEPPVERLSEEEQKVLNYEPETRAAAMPSTSEGQEREERRPASSATQRSDSVQADAATSTYTQAATCENLSNVSETSVPEWIRQSQEKALHSITTAADTDSVSTAPSPQEPQPQSDDEGSLIHRRRGSDRRQHREGTTVHNYKIYGQVNMLLGEKNKVHYDSTSRDHDNRERQDTVDLPTPTEVHERPELHSEQPERVSEAPSDSLSSTERPSESGCSEQRAETPVENRTHSSYRPSPLDSVAHQTAVKQRLLNEEEEEEEEEEEDEEAHQVSVVSELYPDQADDLDVVNLRATGGQAPCTDSRVDDHDCRRMENSSDTRKNAMEPSKESFNTTGDNIVTAFSPANIGTTGAEDTSVRATSTENPGAMSRFRENIGPLIYPVEDPKVGAFRTENPGAMSRWAENTRGWIPPDEDASVMISSVDSNGARSMGSLQANACDTPPVLSANGNSSSSGRTEDVSTVSLMTESVPFTDDELLERECQMTSLDRGDTFDHTAASLDLPNSALAPMLQQQQQQQQQQAEQQQQQQPLPPPPSVEHQDMPQQEASNGLIRSVIAQAAFRSCMSTLAGRE
ncbi:uncharacterized protein [Littorina saxatilis]|uniref:Uncharacterized protein n=1 Tax=Littorina saxatilis TaxID=31220 RepID=A0AAN9AMR3_9CAEN